VEKGVISERDFRDFTFANPVKLWASLNPRFFEGTAVQDQAGRELQNSNDHTNRPADVHE
jgi:hypothetical protein